MRALRSMFFDIKKLDHAGFQYRDEPFFICIKIPLTFFTHYIIIIIKKHKQGDVL